MSRSFLKKIGVLSGGGFSLLVLLAACHPSLPAAAPPTIQPTNTLPILRSELTPISVETATPTLPVGYVDAAYVLDGVCYDALRIIVGTPIVLRSQADLDQYFNNLNSLGVCEGVMLAPTFDFSGQILVGQIQMGQGCDASLYPSPPATDAQVRTVTIWVQFAVTPDCDYEVMGIFLMAINRPPDDYQVLVTIQP